MVAFRHYTVLYPLNTPCNSESFTFYIRATQGKETVSTISTNIPIPGYIIRCGEIVNQYVCS